MAKNTPDNYESDNYLTVRQLRDIVKDWPEVYEDGEPCEVWIETGRGLTSPVLRVERLNLRGNRCDMLLESNAFEVEASEPPSLVSELNELKAKYHVIKTAYRVLMKKLEEAPGVTGETRSDVRRYLDGLRSVNDALEERCKQLGYKLLSVRTDAQLKTEKQRMQDAMIKIATLALKAGNLYYHPHSLEILPNTGFNEDYEVE